MNNRQPAEDAPFSCLAFVVEERDVAQFFLLLQKGVKIRSRVGGSVDAFLREELKAGPEVIEKIQSIMLDGKPVDDIKTAVVHDNSVLALSAAMPGLVGATLRRGGAYSSFRSAITYRETGNACATGEGWVGIKLFNLLMAELGPSLLKRGVLVSAADAADLLRDRLRTFGERSSATFDDKRVDVKMLEGGTTLMGKDKVLLIVKAGSPHLTSP